MVALGCYRGVAESTNKIFAGTPYRIAAVLDLYDSPPAFTYTKQNLGVTLHTLSPRPKVFVTGAGITPGMSEEAIMVWKAYVKNVGLEDAHVINVGFWEVRGSLFVTCIDLCRQMSQWNKGQHDWMTEIKNDLDARFKGV